MRGAAHPIVWRAAIVAIALVMGVTAVLTAGSSAPATLDAQRALIAQGEAASDPRIQSEIRRTLRRDLTQPAALELTALADESRGDRSDAAALYRLSDRLSRRSLATRLWLVQDAVERGNVAAALGQMDIALRTSSAAPKFVFPALARGLDDPRLIGPIARILDRPSEWREAFLIYAADNATPASAASLFFALGDRSLIATDQLDRRLVVRLVSSGQFALARQLDRRFGGSQRPGTLVADGDFTDARARYPFGWGLTNNGELGASRESDGGRAVLAFHANPAERGQLAAQLLTLAPGSYVLASRTGRLTAAEAPPLWTLSCAAPAKLVVMLPLAPGQRAEAEVAFSIPPDCPAQWLALTAQPALVMQSGSIESVAVARR